MFDDLNENNDNLTEESTIPQEENTSPSGEEQSDNLTNASENEGEISSTQGEDNTPVFPDENENPDSETYPPSSPKNEENNSISADLIRGHINTIILRALYERDKYGYEIINDIESKSHGQYTLKQPTLYSALKRLENQGYIKAYWKTDEVTLGGRRKYFTLTESGKEITEKNLSEWEYSRTIIDSLISDKSFDFAKPAPTPVDFSLLRDSVSRVPTVNVNENSESQANQVSQSQEIIRELTEQQQLLEQQIIQQQAELQAMQQQAEQERKRLDEEASAQRIKLEEEAAKLAALSAQEQAAQEKKVNEEELERKRTHENYMRLISEPVRQKPVQVEDTVPGSDNINSDKLLYNNRPETERDYKNLIDGIFFKTIYNGSVQTTYHSKQLQAPQRQQGNRSANASYLVDKGKNDGVRITPSNEHGGSRATKTTYNKGLTLLKSSAVVLAILIIEAIFCFIFMKPLAITAVYPVVIMAIGVVQFAVFAILALNGYGKNSIIPTSHGYISSCIILTIIGVLIIAMFAFLLNMNTALISDILTMLVIPSVTTLNLTVFGLCFKAFIK